MEMATRLVQVETGVRLNVSETGDGEPLLLIMGTGASLGLWGPVADALAESHRTIAYDSRGLGESERGDGILTSASLAADAAALLEALEVERAHVLGWSLGSTVAQELALARPDLVASLVLYATWGRVDGFQRAMFTALKHPWESADIEPCALVLGLAFSPELLNSPELEAILPRFQELFPATDVQIRTTDEQWQADLDHDALDRLGEISAPALVIAGEQDLFSPPWQCREVAERIPGARYELLTGPGSSHVLMVERADEFLGLVRGFLAEHRLS
jgi:pimeloyl-ACP methyl ester carboxylesterase